MGTTEGLAIPADKNPQGLPSEFVFPWEQAAYVVKKAKECDITNIEEIVDSIRNSLGNPNWVSEVLTGWLGAITSLTKAVDGSGNGVGLETANENLKARWTGTASESATSYVGRLVTASREEKTQLQAMYDKINDIGAFVSKSYAANIAHIHNYAARLRENEGNEYDIRVGSFFPGGSDTSIYAEKKRILAEFTRETAAVFKDLTDYLTDVGGSVDTIVSLIAGVEIPGNIAPSVGDPGSWQPRNPTGPPWGQPS
ncbi:hypothetical protein [Nocardia arizonensis]|uniref:hypothetical protein n=1 Tax=Nocardia arizonensis TaxID=1141647 RepID=UPI0006D156B9|nr:hypothetical protein [Nocardia arizonensis]